MKKYLWLLLFISTITGSCNLFGDYGKKVEFGESAVYYKGEGVTEADAQKLGKYLKKQGFFNDAKEKSIQISHDGEDYIVRFVVDEKDITSSIRLVFWKFQYFISQEVFKGKPTRIAFTDDKLEDVEILNPVEKYDLGESFILYDNAEIKKSEAKALADFFVNANILTETSGGVALLTKEDKMPMVRLVVNPKTYKDEMRPEFAFWQEQMKDKVFHGKKSKLILTSSEFEDLKPLPKLTDEERQAFLNRINQTDTPGPDNDYTIDSTVTQSSSGVLRLPN